MFQLGAPSITPHPTLAPLGHLLPQGEKEEPGLRTPLGEKEGARPAGPTRGEGEAAALPPQAAPTALVMTRVLILLALVLVSACAAAPRPQAVVREQAQPAADETPEPLPAGIVPLTREQDERLSQ